jgi:protein TonB
MFERIEVASPSRPWTTAVAFAVNSTALLLAILLPMLKPDQLPALNFRVLTPPYNAPRLEPMNEARPQQAQSATASLNDTAFRAPSRIPIGVHNPPDNQPSGQPGPYIPGASFGDPNLFTGMSILTTSNPPPIPATVKPPRPQMLIISHLDEGMLIRRVQPLYPHVAVITHVQGKVVLSALISTRGEIEGLRVISGSPLLAQAALDAVRQWRYRPYMLNGSPIAVQTEVTVNFSLQQ